MTRRWGGTMTRGWGGTMTREGGGTMTRGCCTMTMEVGRYNDLGVGRYNG